MLKPWFSMSYRFLEHTADVKFRAEGATIEEMFVFAAGALNETIRGEIDILGQEERIFEVEGKDESELLYNFLEEFLYLLDAEDFLIASIKLIEIKPNESGAINNEQLAMGAGFKLKCIVMGDKAENYKFTNDVKAVTYSEMFVKRSLIKEQVTSDKGKGEGWECQVVLDV